MAWRTEKWRFILFFYECYDNVVRSTNLVPEMENKGIRNVKCNLPFSKGELLEMMFHILVLSR